MKKEMKKKTGVLILAVILVVIAIVYIELKKPVVEKTSSSLDISESNYPKAPELVGIKEYINSDENFTLESLRGKVVIVDFWTYSCINCLRTLPYLTAWDEKYRREGLVIIGVHTPEFSFEKKYDNVKAAVELYGIEFPVVLDNDYATWTAYQNRYWPHKYIIDKEGNIRYDHIGEGGYEETERQIQELLSETGVETEGIVSGLVSIEDSTPTTSNTPEIYAGYEFAIPRGQNLGNDEGYVKNKEHNYTLIANIEDTLKPNKLYLEGSWDAGIEGIQKTGTQESAIYLKFSAKNANIVAEGNSYMEVFIDGKYIGSSVAGKDVIFENDKALIKINEPRLYDIYDGPYGTYTLKLTTTGNFSFNSFTFG